MGIALDKFFEVAQQAEYDKQKEKEIWKKTWHIEYFLFSLNKDMFGFVYHNWYCSGGYYYDNEYDYDYKKGFKLYDKYYKEDMIDEERRNAEYDRDYHHNNSDWKWTLNVKCIPLLVYKKEQVGYIAPDGTKKYFKKEEKEYKKKMKAEITEMNKTIKGWEEEVFEM